MLQAIHLPELLEQKQQTKKTLLELYNKILKAFQQIAPAQKFKNPLTLNDKDLVTHCQNFYVFVLGDIMKLPKYGVTEVTLINFRTTIRIFEVIIAETG
jgi:hypothetical protein